MREAQASEYSSGNWDAIVNHETHLALTYAKIARQAKEISILNGVIARRKRGQRRLKAYVDAVKEVHTPLSDFRSKETRCRECDTEWPCRTIDAFETVRMQLVEAIKHDVQ